MNIGFVSTWFERGAAYATKAYLDLLKENHNVFVYARGGEQFGKGDPNWDFPYVTWSPKLLDSNINLNHFKKWIKKNNIDTVFFNEQREIDIVYKIKKLFPNLKVGSYIDYYKDNTVKEFYLYDFLICNTKRHYSVFKEHPQCYYVPWGTNVDDYRPVEKPGKDLTFFHSVGMSNRKGTSFVIDAFINGEIYKDSKLIIHTQKSLKDSFGYDEKELSNYNIEVIEKTVTTPGLYYLGDVYVYPTMLDGLGLTMYEALASGLAVITTDHPPMNEVINSNVGCLVEVDYLKSRADGYYWPLSIVKLDSLIKNMKFFVENPDRLLQMKDTARKEAIEKWNWSDRKKEINKIFTESTVIVKEPDLNLIARHTVLEKFRRRFGSSYMFNIISRIVKK
ncbi:glycosyltransferase [Virgibacillus sp. 6R]|uniref:glycosyltransferase n=1 Tax=Metabacillus sp. 22489 TaxID=3453928 RepID=UPI0011A87264